MLLAEDMMEDMMKDMMDLGLLKLLWLVVWCSRVRCAGGCVVWCCPVRVCGQVQVGSQRQLSPTQVAIRERSGEGG